MSQAAGECPRKRPNIVVILADDMGFSDIGCYGSEIRTPNLDALAAGGVRFSQMYNCARCCPTRASLLTGLYPHQAGVGHMVQDRGIPAYQGRINDRCVTIAEALRSHGYRTLMSGKWHVGGGYEANRPRTWAPGDPSHPMPVQRGFDEHYGMLGGAGSYFDPPYMARDDRIIRPGGGDYYLTDAISDEAVAMIGRAAAERRPFFLYLAYTAPHWPLHARPDDIARYAGLYAGRGWGTLRGERHEALRRLGLVDPAWPLSPPDEGAPDWSGVGDRVWQDLRMAVYAAQIDCMDRGVGRVLAALRAQGLFDDTLILFLSDNGGCAEGLAEDGGKPQPHRYNIPTADGRPMRFGNSATIMPGPDDTFQSYGLAWANASNAPFRKFKSWVHEGGIATPLIAHWPGGGLRRGAIEHTPCHVIDILPTCLAAAGAPYPAEREGQAIAPCEGRSLLPLLTGSRLERGAPLFWEHQGNRAVRRGDWKLVSMHAGGRWELYNLAGDRTETDDRIGREPAVARDLEAHYHAWAARCGVLPWPPPAP